MKKTSVFLICSGLGEVQRGYESFTRECFDTLRDEPNLDMYLFKGGGKTIKEQQEYRLFNLKRKYAINRLLSRITGKDVYFFEQLTFFMSLISYIVLKNPQVIYFSDFLLGCWLAHLKKFLHLKYKLLFSNGAPNGPPFPLFDHVQHVLPFHYTIAINSGEPVIKHSIVPYGISIENTLQLPNSSERKRIKEKLNLPTDKTIIISVAAIDHSHKRMKYLIEEVDKLQDQSIYLLLLGQQNKESAEIITLGNKLLGQENFTARTVRHTEISAYYSIADLFVLASLKEGLPRVLPEALSYGLPIIVHDYAVTRETLQEQGYYTNLEQEYNLAEKIKEVHLNATSGNQQIRKQYAYENYSWDKLRSKYLDMITSL